MTRLLALLLTVLTGFTGLVYEVAWQKSLATLLGSHAEATAAVLGIFLGGLSLGYALFGRVSRSVLAAAPGSSGAPRLLRVYGAVEAGIGLWALAFPLLFAAARSVSAWLPFHRDPAAFVADVGLTILLIGPPTVLMGGTIPLLTQALARSLADATRFHALVYGLNAGGAFAGALAAAFVLVPALGISGTLRAMGVLNLLAGASFALLGALGRGRAAPAPAAAAAGARIEGFAYFAASALLLGFAMMTVQTVLIRLGALSFGASHFTFATVVAVFVLCIAAGSLVVSAFERIPRGAVVLCPLLLLLCLGALYPAMDHLPWGAHLVRGVFRDLDLAFYPYQAVSLLCLLALLAVPVGLSGASLPLLFHELRRAYGELGSTAGRLYSWNTVGNLLGALLGGYALLHWLDLHHVYRVALAAVATAAGLLLARLYPIRRAWLAGAGVALAAVLLAAPAWNPRRMAAGFFRMRFPMAHALEGPDRLLRRDAEILFYDDDPTMSVAVKKHPLGDGGHSLAIINNGKSDGSLDGDYPTMAMISLLSCLATDACNDVFVIGFGTGVTVGEFGALDSTKRVVVAEISRAVLEAAPFFDYGNQGASRNPKVRFVRSDALRALERSQGRFDVIASEPPNVWVTGVETLYSLEFLRAAREKLRPGGVFAQWIHTYEIDRASVELVLRTYAAVFDRVAVWYTLGPDLLLLGLMPEARLDLERIESRMRQPDIRAGFERAGIASLPELLAHELLPLGVVNAASLPGDGVHTLLHPRLSHLAARAFFVGRPAELPPLAGPAAAEAGARQSLLRAWIARQGGLLPETRKALVEELCPDRLRECTSVLAHWYHEQPHSPELAATLDRWQAQVPRVRVERLARLYGEGPPGTLTPQQARRWTESFASGYYHGLPFERAALDSIWRRCRGPECWSAEQEARSALSHLRGDLEPEWEAAPGEAPAGSERETRAAPGDLTRDAGRETRAPQNPPNDLRRP
jgi:predicted membrane-bound spermidine synthase